MNKTPDEMAQDFRKSYRWYVDGETLEERFRAAMNQGYRLAKSEPVYAVVCGNYSPPEIDSLWWRQADAQAKADELGGMWAVQEWKVNGPADRARMLAGSEE